MPAIFTGSLAVTGSIIVTQGVTGSLLGTASYATTASYAHNAASAASATSASFATQANSAFTASSADNFTVRGTLTAQTIVVQTITSSISVVTGSMTVSGALNVLGGITGSLLGTASFANNATSASYALNAANAFVQNGNSFGAQAILGTNDAQNLAFETNGSVRMTISGSNGFVGIATTTPIYYLDVNGSGRFVNEIYTGGVYSATYGPRTNGGTISIIDWNSSTLVRIQTTDGNVGIGTTGPSSKLHIDNAIGSDVIRISDAAGSVRFAIGQESSYTGNYINTRNIDMKLQTYFSGGSGGNIIFQTQTDGTSTVTERMRVNASGSVGIGTATPTSRLEVRASALDADRTVPFNLLTLVAESGNAPYEGFGGGIVFKNRSYTAGMLTGARIRSHIYYSGNAGQEYGAGLAFDITPNTGSSLTEAVRIKYDGNVGIGITNPSNKFVVSNAGASGLEIDPTGGVGSGVLLQAYNRSTSAYMAQSYYALQHTFNVGSGGGTRSLDIDSSGNVGIGTTSPATRLHISKTDGSNELIAARIQNNLGYAEFGVQSGYARILANGALLYAGSDGAQFHYYNGNVVMTIGTGNVGIGTTVPASLLHISGGAQLISYTNNTIASANAALRIDNTSGQSMIYFTFGGVQRGSIRVDSGGNLILNSTSSNFYFNNDFGINSTINFINTNTTFMSVNSSGNVGIGTTVVQSKFHVSAGAVSTPRGGGFSKFFFTDNNTITTYFEIQTPSSSAGDILFSDASGGDYGIIGYDHTTDSMRIYTKSTINMFISGSGFVGIGNTSPTQRLDVTGYARATSGFVGNSGLNLWGDNTSIAPGLFVATGGNVGIGTTNPTAKLQIVGSANSVVFDADARGFSGRYALLPGVFTVGTLGNGYPEIGYNFATSGSSYTKLSNDTSWGINFGNGNVMSFKYAAAGTGAFSWTTFAAFNTAGGLSATSFTGSLLGTASFATSASYAANSANAFIQGGNSFGTTAVLGTNDAQSLSFETNGTVAMTVSSSNVGIGTTSPTSMLTLNGLTPYIRLERAGVPTWEIRQNFPFTEYGFQIVNVTANTIPFFVGANSGSVGIGTTSPEAVLNIVTSPSDTSGNAFAFKGSNGKEFVSINKLGFIRSRASDTNGANMHFFDNAGTKRMEMGIGSTVMNWYSDALASIFLTFQHSSGNIGIGTTAPNTLLHIQGTDPFLRINNASSGDQGIRISYNNATDSGINIIYNPNSAVAIIENTYPLSSGQAWGDFRFRQNVGGTMTTRMTIKNDGGGNVGIGTNTSPAYKLDVQGDIRIPNGSYYYANRSTGGAAIGVLGFAASSDTLTIKGGTSGGNVSIQFQDTGGTIAGFYNGNLGIGTTLPKAKLHVWDSANFGTIAIGNYSYPTLLTSNAGSGEFRVDNRSSAAAGFITFYPNGQDATSGSEAMRINVNGNVGIGTLNPTAPLEVWRNGAAADTTGGGISLLRYQLSNSYRGSSIFHRYIDAGASYDSMVFTVSEGSNPYIATGSALDSRVKMIININGSVGIGTTAPTTGLEVRATAVDANRTVPYNLLTLVAEQGNAPYEGFGGGIVFKNRSYTAGMLTSARIRSNIYFSGNPGDNSGAGLAFDVTANTGSSLTEAVRIKYDGNVGIGVTNPTSKLYVNGTFVSNALWTDASSIAYWGNYSTAYGFLTWDTGYGRISSTAGNKLYLGAAGVHMVIDTSGNVGIGTTAPGTGTGGVGLQIHNASIGAGLKISVGNFYSELQVGSDGTTYMFTTSSKHIVFQTPSTSGNVGIANSTPQYPLDVYRASGLAASFGGQISTSVFAGIHFGYLETANTSYRKSALVFERTDNHGQGANASGKIYMLLDNRSSNTVNTLAASVMTWDTDASATLGSARVGIGSNSPAYALDVAGTIRATADVIAYSDARVKENVKTITNALDKVTSLRGVSYTRIDSKDKSRKIGVIAQEVLEVLPEVVIQDPDSGNYNVAYGNMVGILIEAIKEQQRQIDDLKYLLQTQTK